MILDFKAASSASEIAQLSKYDFSSWYQNSLLWLTTDSASLWLAMEAKISAEAG